MYASMPGQVGRSSTAVDNHGIILGYVYQSGPVLPWIIPGSYLVMYIRVVQYCRG